MSTGGMMTPPRKRYCAERRKTFTREFKLEILRIAENTDKPIAHHEWDLGLIVGTIHH